MNRILVAKEVRAGIDQRDCIKLKSFYTAKETITRVKRHHTNLRKFLLAIHRARHYYPEYKKS
jgi:hypothetical protein